MEQPPFYVKFPDGTKLTFADICNKINLNSGSINYVNSIKKYFVDPIALSISNRNIVVIGFYSQKDGMHVICSANGNLDNSIQIILKDKVKFDQRITAMLASIIALNLFHLIFEAFLPKQRKNWLKSIQRQFYNHSLKHQGYTYYGSGPLFLDLNEKCKEQLKKAAGLTIDGAVGRVKNEFNFLINHFSEDQIIQLWRETITAQVHSS